MGNVFVGKRVVQARITYKRGGTVLETGISNAVYESNSWQPGPLETVWVMDSPNSNAPPTTVNYNFVTIDPHIAG